MNYSAAFTTAAHSAKVHDAVQRYIRHECPVLEQRIKRTALQSAIALLEFAIASFDWAKGQIERSPEYRLRFQLAKIRTYRFFVRLAIRIESARVQYAPKLTAVVDKVFCLS